MGFNFPHNQWFRYWGCVMGNMLIDLKCNTCKAEYLDQWYSTYERKMVSEGRLCCDECYTPLVVMLGTPQFNLKGEGYYEPGKH